LESVLTQTIPGPPPGAGAVLATVSFAAAAPAAGVGEAFLNKPANGFAGCEGDTAGAGVAAVAIAAFFRVVLAAGSTTGAVLAAAAAVAAAVGDVAAAFFFDFFAGEADASAAGDSLAPGDASLAAFFFDFFAGEPDASGEAAGEALAAGDSV